MKVVGIQKKKPEKLILSFILWSHMVQTRLGKFKKVSVTDFQFAEIFQINSHIWYDETPPRPSSSKHKGAKSLMKSYFCPLQFAHFFFAVLYSTYLHQFKIPSWTFSEFKFMNSSQHHMPHS